MRIRAGEAEKDIDLFVFDKDGLLFDSQTFWRAIVYARLDCLARYTNIEQQKKWLSLMRVNFGFKDGHIDVLWIDPSGTFATASPEDECVITAAFLAEQLDIEWSVAREYAQLVFDGADEILDLTACTVPRKGFPRIFERLEKRGIPFGVATSDNHERARSSIGRLYDYDKLSFVVTPREVKWGKPRPDMLLLVSKLTGVEPARMAMVGDSFVDMQMAQNAGAFGIGVPDNDAMREKMKPYGGVLIDSLDDIELL